MTETDPPDEIHWTDDGAPRSRRYDDLFFSDQDGLAESEHVFQQGVGLADRLRAGGRLRIGEIGFGMGLNLLAAGALLDRIRAQTGLESGIDYMGFERSPPQAAEIRRALAPWPALEPRRETLLADWPPRRGSGPRSLDAALDVTLLIGEAEAEIDRLDAPQDVWWLDGFSPAKNPEAWSEALLAKIYDRTAPGGALATYTAAGWVRRGLQRAGFEVARAPGFGSKREMLTARRPQ